MNLRGEPQEPESTPPWPRKALVQGSKVNADEAEAAIEGPRLLRAFGV